MELPKNALRYPIKKLIEELQKLPPGTTYEESNQVFHGGQTGDLGTSYQLNIEICEGFSPRRS